MKRTGKIPCLGISAFSGTGKTTLLESVIPALKKLGIRCAVIKHTHHDVDIDKPGKDSYKLRQAGASPMVLTCSQRTAIVYEHEQTEQLEPDTLISLLNPESFDLVLFEGFKQTNIPRLFLYREEIKGKAFKMNNEIRQIMNDDMTLAIVTDSEEASIQSELSPEASSHKPVLNINEINTICSFIQKFVQTEVIDE